MRLELSEEFCSCNPHLYNICKGLILLMYMAIHFLFDTFLVKSMNDRSFWIVSIFLHFRDLLMWVWGYLVGLVLKY